MNAEEMMARFADGGDSARSAFFEVVNALNAMEDPMAKNTAAVNLFGTMYEDLEANILPVLASMESGTVGMYDALAQINEIKYDDLNSALEGTKRSIEGVFLPAVSEVSGAITDIFSTLSNEINNLGTSSYYWHYAYIGSNTVSIGSTKSSKLGFFGTTPIIKQTLSTSSNNMSYSSATSSNYLYVLNNLVGILKNKYGLIA